MNRAVYQIHCLETLFWENGWRYHIFADIFISNSMKAFFSSKFAKKIFTTLVGSYRSMAYKCISRRTVEMPTAGGSIDIVIPIVEKDLAVLPLCVEGIRRCSNNPVQAIYVVAPAVERIRSVAESLGLVFVDERTVLGYTPKDLQVVTVNGTNRSGWIFQQLLKLSGAIGTCRHFAVIDADHILLRPHTFVTADGKCVFYRSAEYYYPYYENIYRLTGKFPCSTLSYIAHKMVFDKERLAVLRNTLEKRNGMSWDKAILHSLDLRYGSSFSEFELYGNTFPDDEKVSLPWCQQALHKSDTLPHYDTLYHKYAHRYLSVTFPDYMAL